MPVATTTAIHRVGTTFAQHPSPFSPAAALTTARTAFVTETVTCSRQPSLSTPPRSPPGNPPLPSPLSPLTLHSTISSTLLSLQKIQPSYTQRALPRSVTLERECSALPSVSDIPRWVHASSTEVHPGPVALSLPHVPPLIPPSVMSRGQWAALLSSKHLRLFILSVCGRVFVCMC